MFDFFELDYFFDDAGKQVFLLAKIYYEPPFDAFITHKIAYYFARCIDGIFHIFDKGLEFENDFEEFIMCYGEELGVPLRKECILFEITTD